RKDHARILIDWLRMLAPRCERAQHTLEELPMNGAVMTLARWEARQVIKRQLYAQGIKVARVEASEISRAANQYIDDHPEIIAFATERYRTLVATGRLRPPRKLKLCRT